MLVEGDIVFSKNDAMVYSGVSFRYTFTNHWLKSEGINQKRLDYQKWKDHHLICDYRRAECRERLVFQKSPNDIKDT
jgi:hypothetical protein